eukprot:9763151-Karenia_brevis.AAC.1
MVSTLDKAKRALVSVILAFATAYKIALQINRDSADGEVRSAYRRLSRRAHPDRGGSNEDQQKLNDAYSAWTRAGESTRGRGKPAAPPDTGASDMGVLPTKSETKRA